jgi:hypothetical protein
MGITKILNDIRRKRLRGSIHNPRLSSRGNFHQQLAAAAKLLKPSGAKTTSVTGQETPELTHPKNVFKKNEPASDALLLREKIYSCK